MNVNIKKLDKNAVIPQYAKPGDAGMDVVATSINVTDDYIWIVDIEVSLNYVLSAVT